MLAFQRVVPRNWLLSLLAEKRITIDSSSDVIRAIQRRQLKRQHYGYDGPVKQPTSVRRFSAPRRAGVQPLALLHAVGRITTPLVPNLADLSSTWALYRYIWAFDPDSPEICLSETARGIDFHQKGLLSDEIGVGMAYWVMVQYFNAEAVVDVDVALRNPRFAATLGIPHVIAGGKEAPDYIFALPNDRYAIVECKGSQSGKSTSLDQLRRGLEQVPAISFAHGESAQEFVIATLLSSTRTVVYLVDPPANSLGNPTSGKRRFVVRERRRFDELVARLQAASLLSFAGAEGRAAQIAGVEVEEGQPVREPGERIRVPEVDTDFLGRSFTMPFRGLRGFELTGFYGLPVRIYEYLYGEEFLRGDRPHWIQAEYWPWLVERAGRGRRSIITLASEEERRVYSFGADGSFLQLSIA